MEEAAEMQIYLTKKLAEASSTALTPAFDDIDPFFCWTANWTNTFDCRKEDMVVMVNNATRFCGRLPFFASDRQTGGRDCIW